MPARFTGPKLCVYLVSFSSYSTFFVKVANLTTQLTFVAPIDGDPIRILPWPFARKLVSQDIVWYYLHCSMFSNFDTVRFLSKTPKTFTRLNQRLCLRKCRKISVKNPIISYLFIAVVIKYSLLEKGRGGNGNGPKAAVYRYLRDITEVEFFLQRSWESYTPMLKFSRRPRYRLLLLVDWKLLMSLCRYQTW